MLYIVQLCVHLRCTDIRQCFATVLFHFFLYVYLSLLNNCPYIKKLLVHVFLFARQQHLVVYFCHSAFKLMLSHLSVILALISVQCYFYFRQR